MEELAALAEQQAELSSLLDGLDDENNRVLEVRVELPDEYSPASSEHVPESDGPESDDGRRPETDEDHE